MAPDRLLFLHLSDIHFCRRRDEGYDLNSDLRNELERDVSRLRDKLGDAAAILVTGDIGFSGKADEYKIASDWLKTLAELAGCRSENVWTTPGNHDVDRSVVSGSAVLEDMHRNLRPNDPAAVDENLDRYLQDPIASEWLFRPLQKYNDFASGFGCQIGPSRLVWTQDLALNDGSTLRLRGLNSTLVSDHRDRVTTGKLILGSRQYLLRAEEGVEYLTLCHHPPQWLIDEDRADDALRARARIQLFGHKHRQRVMQIDNTVRLAAGAVHPDTTEREWQPRFNVLCVSVSSSNEQRTLQVEVHPRVWSDTDLRFVADRDADGMDIRGYSLPIPAWAAPGPRAREATAQGLIAEAASPAFSEPLTRRIEAGEGTPMDPTRRLTYRFLGLPYHDRMAIANELDLLRDEDKGLQDADLFARFFRRAFERSLLEKLWAAVERRHDDGNPQDNPFSGR